MGQEVKKLIHLLNVIFLEVHILTTTYQKAGSMPGVRLEVKKLVHLQNVIVLGKVF